MSTLKLYVAGLSLMLIYLKLTGAISWAWGWVLAPVWVFVVFVLLLIIVVELARAWHKQHGNQ